MEQLDVAPRRPPRRPQLEVVRTVVYVVGSTVAPTEAPASPVDPRRPRLALTLPRGPNPMVAQTLTSEPVPHEVEKEVTGVPSIVVKTGALVIEAAALMVLDTPADTPEAVGSTVASTEAPAMPLEPRTPALTPTLPSGPKPTVAHTLTSEPVPQEVEKEVMGRSLMVVRTAGLVIVGTAAVTDDPTEAPTPALIRLLEVPVGSTPALRETVAISPKPKVTHASTAFPEHDAEMAVIVLPSVTMLVGTTSPFVREGSRVALTSALTIPLEGRTSAPRLTVPAGPRPKEAHTPTSAPVPHDVEIAVMVLPSMIVLVGRTAGIVIAGADTPAVAETPSPRPALTETMLPSVFKAPRLKVADGPPCTLR